MHRESERKKRIVVFSFVNWLKWKMYMQSHKKPTNNVTAAIDVRWNEMWIQITNEWKKENAKKNIEW